jgi:hypothetical protein
MSIKVQDCMSIKEFEKCIARCHREALVLIQMEVAPSNDALVFRQGSSQARQSSSAADVSRYFSARPGA